MNRPNRFRKLRIIFYMFFIFSLIYSVFLTSPSSADTSRPIVYVVPVTETIEAGLHAFMERAFKEAEEARADHILLEMNTYGGAVQAADDIGKLLQETSIPISVFINNSAISAGAYIALNADNIIMVPTATMGSATVVDMEGNAGDAKAMSMWVRAMRSAAESNDRDPYYAEAMVNQEIKIEGFDQPLTFSASEALEHGYAEKIANTRVEVLEFLGLEEAIIEEVEISFAEKIARFVTNPIVVSILFSLASLGLILELYSPGFGIPGTIGISALLLFFFGHMIAGFAGWESLLLFGIGVILIVMEIFTAGFGIFGILGLASVISSLALASVDIVSGLKSMGVAVLITIVVMGMLGKYLDKRGFWSKLVLQENLSEEESKTTFKQKSELIGKIGVTLTQLRPAGTAKIGDMRYDVVSEGSFTDIHTAVKVIFVEGTRIVVREVED